MSGWEINVMRLVCPNCGAKYEVADDAIPEGGRDVQCSGCGHAWFQRHTATELAAAEIAAVAEPALFDDDIAAESDDPLSPEAILAREASPEPELSTDAVATLIAETDVGPEAAADPVPAPPAPVKRELDDDVLAVLREEAERESDARRAEAQRAGSMRAEAEGQMQTQPELGVDGAAPAALSPTQRRLAMLKGTDPDAPPPAPAKPTTRRDLLPDVEEINSTLQPSDATRDPDAEVNSLPDLTKRSGSFRSGFFLMLLLLVIAAAVYIAAPKLAAQFPALNDPLATYVAFVDGLRLSLNNLVNRATAALNGYGG